MQNHNWNNSRAAKQEHGERPEVHPLKELANQQVVVASCQRQPCFCTKRKTNQEGGRKTRHYRLQNRHIPGQENTPHIITERGR